MYWRLKREMKKAVEAIAIQQPLKKCTPAEPRGFPTLFRSRRVAVILCLLLLTLTATTMAITFFRLDYSVEQQKVTLFMGSGAKETAANEKEAYQRISEQFSSPVLHPSKLPAGMRIGDKVGYSEHTFIIQYIDNEFHKLNYRIQSTDFDDLTGIVVDTENGTVENIQIHNWDVTLCQSTQKGENGAVWYAAKWNDAGLYYSVQTNLSRDEVIQFIQNLTYTP